jgi:3-oxoacyl-[acyl-carrier-protein] synthase III
MSGQDPFGISAISYRVPTTRKSVRDLAAEGRLISEPEALEELGFRYCLMWDQPATDVAAACVRDVLKEAKVAPGEVDLLINASALASSSVVPPGYGAPLTPDNEQLYPFMYSTSRIQDELDLVSAHTMGLTELSCSSLMGAVWTAKAIMAQDDLDVAVCVNADVFAKGTKREVVYNVVSDSACAVVLRRGEEKNRVMAYNQMTKGYYWDCDRRQNELIASYFTTGKRIVEKTLKRAGLTLADIAMIVPHNVSMRSWDILSRHIGYPLEKIYTANIAERAHSIASDNFLNMKDVLDRGLVKSGDIIMLYCFGLGAHWGCSLVRV